jgi:hypothetical protein
MTIPRRTLIALLLVAAVAVTSAALAFGGAAGPPKRAYVTSHGLRAPTVLGSYCSSGQTEAGTGVAGCGDAEYPLRPRVYLPATSGATLRVNLRKRAKSVSAHLVRGRDADYSLDSESLAAKPANSRRRVWRLELPDDLRRVTAVSISTQWAGGGDADFWAGLKPVKHWP